jgi:predicted metal-dependent HD superfamily phosphohydrolase
MTHSSEGLPAQEKTKMEVLQEDFCGIFGENRKSDAMKLSKKIAEEYQAENRSYHNFEHIENLLSFLKERESEIRDLNSIKLAVWLHDVVYDTKANDNEEQSSQYAQNYLEQLGIPAEIISRVVALIMATVKHEAIENDSDSAIFLDADLAILGSGEENYDKYAAKIRKEYAWVSDEQYSAGRIKVLESFLQRPRIYFTEEAGKELGQQARKNIEREITRLS